MLLMLDFILNFWAQKVILNFSNEGNYYHFGINYKNGKKYQHKLNVMNFCMNF